MRTLRTALFVFLLVPSLYATSYVVPTDREMIDAAPAIVRGTVIDTYCRRAADGTLETVTEVRVEERLKGGTDARTMEIVQWGGQLGDEWMAQSDAPLFTRGERVLLFLERSRSGAWTTYSVGLGAFRFARDAYGEPLVRRTAISGWTEDGEEHVERARREKPFLDFIRATVGGADGDRVIPDYFADEAVSMRRIVTHAPFLAGGYTFPFVGSTPSRRRDNNLNIAWRPIGTQGGLSFEAAIDFGNGQWNGQSPKISYSRGATATGNTRGSDAEHRIIANDPNGDIAGSFGGSGVVGTAFSFGSSTFTFNDETFQSITHSDIVIQDGVSSANISASVFNVVMTHELGHTFGLRHSNLGQNGVSACAAPLDCCINTSAGGNCRAIMMASAVSLSGLQAWDRNAIDCLYDGVCLESGACAPPSISTQPQNRSIAAGATTSLSVVAGGTGPFTYQWYIGNSGNTSSPTGTNSATLSGLSPAGTTSYWVRVTGQCPAPADSNTATITVEPCVPASIATHPASRSITAGTTTNLSVSAAGTGSFTYQWLVGQGDTWAPVGSNSSTLSGLSPSTTTHYLVRVTGRCGPTVDSNIATITVTSCANVILQSASATTGTGGSVTLAAAAAGGTGITYTWFQGDTPGVGGTQIGTGTPLLTTISGTTNFWVRARNSCGNSSVSNLLTAALCGLPSILTQPADQTLNAGAPVTLTIALVAPGSTVRWFRGAPQDKTAEVGIGETIAVGPLAATATFWAAVTNSCGEVPSRVVTITIAECSAPSITTQPLPQTTIKPGQTVTLSVVATGTPALTYAWFRGELGDTSVPVGANAADFTSETLTQETKFWVRVTNGCGAADSTAAIVKVPLSRRRSVR